nr:PH domain-containing protein [uncultured Actinoplanes sp.]
MRRNNGTIGPGATALLVTAAIYGVLFAVTTGSWPIPVIVVGGLLVITAAAAAVRYRWAHRPLWVHGTGEVVEVSPPPPAGTHGTCELTLTISTPGLGAARQRVRERHVSVPSWPAAGDRLPVQIDVNDRRRVRVLWSQASRRAELDDDLDDLAPPPWASRDRPGDDEASPPVVSSPPSARRRPSPRRRAEIDDDFDFGYAEPALGERPPPPPPPPPPAPRPAAEPSPWDDPDPAFDDPAPFRAYRPEEVYEPTFTEDDLETLLPPRRVLPLTDEPTSLVARYLYPTERYRGEWRRHWVRPFGRYVLVLAVAVLLTVEAGHLVPEAHLTTARGVVCLTGALLSLYALIAWRFAALALTSRRVLLVEGLLWRRVSSLTIEDMSQVRLEQTPLGQLLNYGDFIFESARRFTAIRRVAVLPYPNELYLRVTEERHDPEAVEARMASYDNAGDFDDP